MSDRDYYEILGLTPRADGMMVDGAYWHLARKYQALAATNSRAQGLLDELNEAYGVLGNPRLREQYDAFRDDVLVQAGMIQPVRSKPKQRSAAPKGEKAGGGGFSLRSVSIEHWQTYITSTTIVMLAFAGLWQGVDFLFVSIMLVAGLTFSLAPILRRRLPGINISMPSISMPTLSAPRLSMPQLPELSGPGLHEMHIGNANDEQMDADELRVSTAATIARWRRSVGLRESQATSEGGEPDTTLVEIVSSERKMDDASEPLTAVLDILRGSQRTSAGS